MSEKTSQEQPKAKPKRGKLILIVAALMGLEGVGVFILVKALSSPPQIAEAGEHEGVAEAHADDAAEEGHAKNAESEHGGDAKTGGKGEKQAKLSLAQSEIELPECRPSNRETGKLILFRMRVSVLVSTPQVERAKALIDANKSKIHDRINYVIRSADPLHLNEPGLETIKRRIKQELDGVTGDADLIQEVLIPELLQSGYGL